MPLKVLCCFCGHFYQTILFESLWRKSYLGKISAQKKIECLHEFSSLKHYPIFFSSKQFDLIEKPVKFWNLELQLIIASTSKMFVQFKCSEKGWTVKNKDEILSHGKKCWPPLQWLGIGQPINFFHDKTMNFLEALQ